MPRRRRLLAAAALVLVAGLAGCSFLDDLAQGQRITTDRLRAADALRVLVGQLEQLDGVEAARFHFDAVDVTSVPGVDVELTSVDAAAWRAAARLIEEAADEESLNAYTLAAALSAGTVVARFDTQWGSAWLGDDAVATAARAVELFPEATVVVGGGGSAAFVSTGVTESAEELLARVTGDDDVVALLTGLDPARVAVEFRAAGLSLSGALTSPEAVAWATGILSSELPRLPIAADAAPVTEWVSVTMSSGIDGTILGVELVGDTELATGPAWTRLLDLLTAPVPELDGPGTCVPLQITYSWPGVQGNWPSFTNDCVDWGSSSGDSDRPSLVALREALAASGIDLEVLGYRLT